MGKAKKVRVTTSISGLSKEDFKPKPPLLKKNSKCGICGKPTDSSHPLTTKTVLERNPSLAEKYELLQKPYSCFDACKECYDSLEPVYQSVCGVCKKPTDASRPILVKTIMDKKPEFAEAYGLQRQPLACFDVCKECYNIIMSVD